jgi:hypothetical protein
MVPSVADYGIRLFIINFLIGSKVNPKKAGKKAFNNFLYET